MTGRSRSVGLVTIAVAGALALAGCTSTQGGASPATTTSPSGISSLVGSSSAVVSSSAATSAPSSTTTTPLASSAAESSSSVPPSTTVASSTIPASTASSSSSSKPATSATTRTATTSTGTSATDWPTYHGNPQRTGVSTTMPAVAGPLRATRIDLGAAVYASPLVVGGRTIVATEADTVVALDATNKQLWSIKLGTPSPQSERKCGDIDPLGITGTPVYDATTALIYLVAEFAAPVRHVLFALRPADGSIVWQRSVDEPGATAADMQQRGALAVAGGRVWVTFGAQFGDCGDYQGRLVGVPLDGRGDPVVYDESTHPQGGMWNAAGPTVAPDGTLLVVTANGSTGPGDAYDHTNSVLQVSTAGRLLDSFAPSDWAENNAGDVGLGSQGASLVGSQWVVLGGKSGPVYVLRQGKLGGIGGEVSQSDICRSFGGAAVQGDVIYLPCTDGVRAVQVSAAGTLSVRWHAPAAVAGSPVIGGGRVWALDQRGGALYAFDPATGAVREQVPVGTTSRFATPALSGDRVLVPTMSGLTVVTTS